MIGSRQSVLIRHPNLGAPGTNWIRVPRGDVEDLDEHGFLRIEKTKSKQYGESWEFDLRPAALLAFLDAKVENAPTEEERTRFRDLRNRAADVGQSLLTDVLAKVILGG
jgi:hypothetical protein